MEHYLPVPQHTLFFYIINFVVDTRSYCGGCAAKDCDHAEAPQAVCDVTTVLSTKSVNPTKENRLIVCSMLSTTVKGAEA